MDDPGRMSTRVQELLEEASRAFNSSEHAHATNLDAEILLAHVLGCSRASILANPDKPITTAQQAEFKHLYTRRANDEPTAYLIGSKEFWSLPIAVNASVLVPRPETELLVQRSLYHCGSSARKIVDLGTGSGAVALALAFELPESEIIAVDISTEAVKTAQHNIRSLQLKNVEVVQSDWFTALGNEKFDCVVANPPYVDSSDPHLAGSIRYEPRDALVAGESGTAELKTIVRNAPSHLVKGGWLVVEHGYDQSAPVKSFFAEGGFDFVRTHRDLGGMDRVTEGQWNQR